jgi:hypothetical protein
MRKLDDRADDARLEGGQAVEERIHAMDYDVWVCACGGQRVDKYLGRSPHDQCPKCRFHTQSHTRKVIQEADETSAGLALTYACKNCRHITRSVPSRITRLLPLPPTPQAAAGAVLWGGPAAAGFRLELLTQAGRVSARGNRS